MILLKLLILKRAKDQSQIEPDITHMDIYQFGLIGVLLSPSLRNASFVFLQ